jgi:hypothetical protein
MHSTSHDSTNHDAPPPVIFQATAAVQMHLPTLSECGQMHSEGGAYVRDVVTARMQSHTCLYCYSTRSRCPSRFISQFTRLYGKHAASLLRQDLYAEIVAETPRGHAYHTRRPTHAVSVPRVSQQDIHPEREPPSTRAHTQRCEEQGLPILLPRVQQERLPGPAQAIVSKATKPIRNSSFPRERFPRTPSDFLWRRTERAAWRPNLWHD